ncbi:MAG: acetate--CoA ligase family protein [Actinobacteria bacterium]|nr:acetate--CoA ligase family protein [Actinomycetota bacterium]
MPDLTRLLAPRSVAVVGATDREGSYANATLLNLARAGFAGDVVGVHPTRTSAAGFPCVPSLLDVGPVDAVVIATPAETVPAYVAQARERGCGGAVVYAAGFAESGRGDLQDELNAAAGDLAVIGPNGNGLVSVAARAPLWGDAVALPAAAGGIALVSESGNVGVIGMGHRGGLGLHTVISIGNAAVVDSAMAVEHLAQLQGVRAIALYLEADGDGTSWCRALAACSERDVRLVVLKVGRSSRGAAVGQAHTAAIVGDQTVFAAMMEEAGAVMVRQPLELLETARALAVGRRDPRGAGVLTCSGGDAAIAADLAADLGVGLADLSDATEQRLRELLPPAATVANPLDHTALVWADTEAIAALAETVGRDPGVGHLVYVQDEPPGLPAGSLAEWRATRLGGVVGGERAGHDTLVVATLPGQGAADAVEGLDNALRSLAALQGARSSQHRLLDMATAASVVGRENAPISEPEAKAMLARHGIPVPRGQVAVSANEAVDAALEVGFPVVLKAVVPGLLHKSDVGGVVVGVRTAEDVQREAGRLLAVHAGCGILVEEMVEPGLEVLVCARRDGVVPTLTIGLGGVWTEALSDVAVIPLPADIDRVRVAVESLRAVRLLRGDRGGTAYDVDGLCALASGVGDALLTQQCRLIEVNPCIVGATQSIAVDAIIA